MSLNKLMLALLAPLCFTINANAAGESVKPATLATCVTCHGSKGEGNATLFAPALAGQRVEYLARQLHAFKAGVRGEHPDDLQGKTMRGMAAGLSNNEIEQLAMHFSSLTPVASTYSGTGKATEGKEIYIATCSACHGLRGEGYAQLQSPNLQVLGADYMSAQMKSYVKGWRGASPHSELPAVWMHSIANQILDATQLSHVFAYLGSLAK